MKGHYKFFLVVAIMGATCRRKCRRILIHRSASISVIAFSKDVCDCGRLELVKVWDGRIDYGSVWIVGEVVP